MRRFASIALVAAIGVLVVVAAIDALDPGGDGRTRGEVFPNREELSARLRSVGVSGRLFYTDASCRLRVLALPDLVPGTPPEASGVGCEFSLSPDGSRVASFAARWDRRGRLIARCRGAVVDFVTDEGSAPHGLYDGCAPAWRPGGSLRYVDDDAVQEVPGSLTLVRDGELLQVTGCDAEDPPACELVLLSRSDLRRAARRHPNLADAVGEPSVDVRDVVWLSRSRVVLLLEATVPLGPPRQQLIAIFDGRRLVATRPRYTGAVARLEARGIVVAAEPVEIFRADGSTVGLPELTAVHAFGLAPDGRWVAAASRGAVHLVRLSPRPGVRIVDLPVVARDVAWR